MVLKTEAETLAYHRGLRDFYRRCVASRTGVYLDGEINLYDVATVISRLAEEERAAMLAVAPGEAYKVMLSFPRCSLP